MHTPFRRPGSRRQRLARAIALLFLIYTAIDLAAPELCKGEGSAVCPGVQIVGTRRVEAASMGAVIECSGDLNQKEPAENSQGDEDCFCCCTHVIPEVVTASLEASDVASLAGAHKKLSLTSPAIPPAFHPPRSA
jgi:hypothetical protein